MHAGAGLNHDGIDFLSCKGEVLFLCFDFVVAVLIFLLGLFFFSLGIRQDNFMSWLMIFIKNQQRNFELVGSVFIMR